MTGVGVNLLLYDLYGNCEQLYALSAGPGVKFFAAKATSFRQTHACGKRL